MITYEICAKRSLDNTWIFFEDDESGRLVPRKGYRDLVCRACGKLDEEKAIARGIDEGVKVHSGEDWVATCDDCILASQRLQNHITSHGFGGLSFLPLDQTGYALATCDCRVATDEVLAGFENIKKCVRCGRYQERIIGPLLKGMSVPDSDDTFFVSVIANENVKVAYRPIFASARIVENLTLAGITGVDFAEAL